MRAAMRSTRPLCCVSVRASCVPIFIMHYLQLRNPQRFVSLSLSFPRLLRPATLPLPTLLYCSLPHRHFIPSRVILSLGLLLSRLFLPWRHGFFYTSVAVDRHSIVPLRLTSCSFCPFYPRPFFAPPCSRIKLALLFCSCNRYTRKRAR